MNRRKLRRWLRFSARWFLVFPIEIVVYSIFVVVPFLYYYARRKGIEKGQMVKLREELASVKERVAYQVTRKYADFACIIVGVDNHPFWIFSDPDIMDEIDKLVKSSVKVSGIDFQYHEFWDI